MENRLRYLLSKNADFEFYDTEIDGKHVELIRIHKSLNAPVAFQKIDYIRSGSLRIPVDTRSPIPVISVHSVDNLPCCWQKLILFSHTISVFMESFT